MIKAVVFDAGGVLVDLNLNDCRSAFKSVLGFDKIDLLLDPCHQKGIYGDMEEGRISSAEFVAKVLEDSRPGSTPEMVDYCMGALLKGIHPTKVALLKSLAERGYDLYILSNNNEISWAHFCRIFQEAGVPAEQTFKKSFISCRMGILKPDPAIFRMVIEDLGLEPGEILFVDDSERNAAAACAAGMKGLHYDVGTDLAALINSEL